MENLSLRVQAEHTKVPDNSPMPLSSILEEHFRTSRDTSQHSDALSRVRGIYGNPEDLESSVHEQEMAQELIYTENSTRARDISTPCLSRTGIFELIKAASDQEIPALYFVFFDINFLKDINERLGRETTGNACVHAILNFLNQKASGFNGIVARYEGDESLAVFQTKEERDAFLVDFDESYATISYEDWVRGVIDGCQVIDRSTKKPSIPDRRAIEKLRHENPALFDILYPPTVTKSVFELDLSTRHPGLSQREYFELFKQLVTRADAACGRQKDQMVSSLSDDLQRQLKRGVVKFI